MEIPYNWNDIKDLVETDTGEIISSIIASDKLFFYDTCSFRRHSNLSEKGKHFFVEYFKNKKSRE